MTEQLSIPLRDRKRAETWASIHHAAADLALQKGLRFVTVDAIVERANVSARTFFNYFAAKEDAILGLQEPVIEDHVREEFTLTGDFLRRVSALLLTVAQTTFGGDYATSKRPDVLQKFPELLQRRISYITKVETLVTDLVQQRLEESPEWLADVPSVSAAEIAQVLVMAGSATMRFAMQRGAPVVTGTEAQFTALDGATTIFEQILRKAV